MKHYSWFYALALLCTLALSASTLACGSDEGMERREPSASERATPASSDEGNDSAKDRVSSQVASSPSDVFAFIPADVEVLALLDVRTIRNNRHRFPGSFRTFEEELVEKIEAEFNTEEIGFEQVGYFVRFEYDGTDETLVTGDLAFADIRDDWDEQDLGEDSRGDYEIWEIWDSEIAVFEDDGAMLTAGQREQLDSLAGEPGPLADTEETDLGIILDKLGNSPAIFADVDRDYGCDLDGCLGYGAAFAGFDSDRQWIHADLVVLFNAEGRAGEAVDEREELVEEMDDLLQEIAWELSEYIGVSEFGTTIDEIRHDERFALGSGIIWLQEESAPPPTAAPIRATRVPTPTPETPATPRTLPRGTQTPRATPSGPLATPRPTPSLPATGGPGAVYRGDGNWAALAGPAVMPDYQGYLGELGDPDGQVPLDAILKHQWIFESDYYRSLAEKASLDNPTPLTSSGRNITLEFACISRSLYWCQHLETYFIPNVAERTNGQVRIEVSSLPELGLPGTGTAGLLAEGTLEMAEIYGGYISGSFPSWELLSLWGLWPDDRSRFEALTAVAPDLNQMVADDMGSQPLFRNWIADGGVFLFSNEALETPEDFGGLRVRSFGAPLSDWITGMGGEPRLMAFAEIYTALDRRNLDAGVTSADAAYGQRLYEVADQMYGPLDNFDSTISAISNQVWDRMPTDLQQILIEEGARHELESLRLAAVQGITAVKRITDTRIQLVEFSPEIQAKSLRIAMECVIPGWLERIGYASTEGCVAAAGSKGQPTAPRATPYWTPPTPTPQEKLVLAARGVEAVDIFNRKVGPIVGLRIEADGTVSELR